MATVRVLTGLAEQDLARELFNEVWPSDETQVTSNLLQALVHNGAYIAGAFVDGEIVAAALAFPGVDENKHLHLHSHMAAVKEKFRNLNIGRELKLHQREWALARGYQTITWTFDPLVRRNAKLNIVRLGVRIYDYFPDFYGEMPDALNANDPTDRVIAHWEISKDWSPTISGEAIPVALANVSGAPVQREVSGTSVLCYLPEDIIALRTDDAALASQWRYALRAQLHPRLSAGWQITGFTEDGAYIVTQSSTSTK